MCRWSGDRSGSFKFFMKHCISVTSYFNFEHKMLNGVIYWIVDIIFI